MKKSDNILLESNVYKGIVDRLNLTGTLRSIRITWEAIVGDDTCDNLIDVAQKIANSEITTIYKNGDNNLIFIIIQFENRVVAEIEINGCFVNNRPPAFFIYTNSTEGILTNRPIVGHFPVDGSVLIDDNTINYERSETIFQY